MGVEQGRSTLLKNLMPKEKTNGREAAFSEEDIQREKLGPRGVPDKESPAKTTAPSREENPQDVDPGHTA
jgi:hypothetical protein